MRTTPMTEKLYDYVLAHTPYANPVLKELEEVTRSRPDAGMQISRDQGMFMYQWVKALQPKRIVEVGCFTGYSSIAMASALSPNGELYTLDINPETMKLAESFFKKAGLQTKIKSKLGPATESLRTLIQELGKGSFDMAFVDADKTSYSEYYELCLELLRPGGFLLVDNVIWSGKVIDTNDQSADTKALRNLNQKIQTDQRVEAMMLHISDGIMIVRKK